MIYSKHIVPQLFLHISSFKVRLVKDKAIRACSAHESVQPGRIIFSGSSLRYCQAVCAVRADWCLASAADFKHTAFAYMLEA